MFFLCERFLVALQVEERTFHQPKAFKWLFRYKRELFISLQSFLFPLQLEKGTFHQPTKLFIPSSSRRANFSSAYKAF